MPEPRLIYAANNRLPTEKAHGLQIVQMCEALADTGYDVTLVTPRRINTPEMRAVRSLWDHYGVAQNFEFRRLWCLDLLPLFPRFRFAFFTQSITYLVRLLIWLLRQQVDVLYTRDLLVGAALALDHPRTTLVYEVHQVHSSWLGQRVQGFLARRAHVVAVTGHLAAHMRTLGAPRILVAHDGFRAARFADVPSRAQARAELGIPLEAFVVGYVGRLHTMEMPKGLDTLVEAIAHAVKTGMEIDLLLVGGPDDSAAALRDQWVAQGLPPERLHTTGQVAPDVVPRTMAAMDVGVMPLPWTEHFAYHASALKLFEYMAAGCAVVASDLPSTAEVLHSGESGWLVPPGDALALAEALQRLYADRDLCRRLSEKAQNDVQQYTWSARAARIRAFIEGKS
jgi:glycosyltransferase involved in cell wall biosynthesis